MDPKLCPPPLADRRKSFWTTQPAACGEYTMCGHECGRSGLEYINQPTGRTFATSDWVRSLLLNIFNTTARSAESACGDLPGRQGGHWSESYGDGTYIGTHMFETKQYASFREAMNVLKAKIAKDAFKLVTYGVATGVDVETKYLGGSRVSVDITVRGPNPVEGIVNLSVERISNAWVWQ